MHEEVRVRGLSEKLKKDLTNISKNLNVTQSQLLKPILQKFVDAQPDHLRRDPNGQVGD